ncbi:YggT family protein [Candidatus Chloroploca sp. M-50]|jgi:YggT family protein|uniref:YggT family protein n=1 Tax=Candidatus Chloroploca mongolica TaxID=2528176 RepID=A0ABS4D7W1_9CHLR|nr:YggT family protein [Candidatus Chloroploca mongolica]MBP1465531.1 YggT family protein [Candidatus Chloroploca mongolica]NCC34736.1 YggT family protein [Chloroflexia bacterium]
MSGFFVTFINLLFQVLLFAILGRVIISWIDPMGNMRVTQILRELTEPILAPIRSVLPTMGMIDLSPLVALLLLQLLQSLILRAI